MAKAFQFVFQNDEQGNITHMGVGVYPFQKKSIEVLMTGVPDFHDLESFEVWAAGAHTKTAYDLKYPTEQHKLDHIQAHLESQQFIADIIALCASNETARAFLADKLLENPSEYLLRTGIEFGVTLPPSFADAVSKLS
jgi:hypothetical protein